MAIRQFALPLDENSVQTGEITFKQMRDNGMSVVMDITNIIQGSGSLDHLILRTRKNGTTLDHDFNIVVNSGTAEATITAAQISTIYNDAYNGEWDYVEACWVVGSTDTPTTSVMHEIQDGKTFDLSGWPPKPK
jgi:hypothetical protein